MVKEHIQGRHPIGVESSWTHVKLFELLIDRILGTSLIIVNHKFKNESVIKGISVATIFHNIYGLTTSAWSSKKGNQKSANNGPECQLI